MNYDKSRPLAGFQFKRLGAGYYKVTYQSDFDVKHNRIWYRSILDMTIIDKTLNCDQIKRKDVQYLRRLVKEGGLKRYEL